MVASGHFGADGPRFAVAEIAADRIARAAADGDATKLAAGIDALARALAAVPSDHELRGKYMTYLAAAYRSRYGLAGDLEDLRAGIEWGKRAVDAIPVAHPGHGMALYILAEDYLRRFRRTDAIEDLQASIDTGERVLAGTDSSAGGPVRTLRGAMLGVLAGTYQLRFERTRAAGDLAASVQRGEGALEIRDATDEGRHDLLIAVATALMTQYELAHEPATLRKGIDRLDEALALTRVPSDDANRCDVLWTSATAYLQMFRHTRQLGDLQRCAMRMREALVSMDAERLGQFDVGVRAGDLASAFLGVESPDGIQQAVEFGRMAVERMPVGHPDELAVLSNLSLAYRNQFEQLGNPHDIRDAIDFGEQAVRRTRTGHPPPPEVRGAVMQNLSLCYRRRFELGGDAADLRSAERFAALAVEPLGGNPPP